MIYTLKSEWKWKIQKSEQKSVVSADYMLTSSREKAEQPLVFSRCRTKAFKHIQVASLMFLHCTLYKTAGKDKNQNKPWISKHMPLVSQSLSFKIIKLHFKDIALYCQYTVFCYNASPFYLHHPSHMRWTQRKSQGLLFNGALRWYSLTWEISRHHVKFALRWPSVIGADAALLHAARN